MGYITTERVAEIRKELKALFPDFKISITKESYSTVAIAILEAPLLLTEKFYEQINHYCIDSIEDEAKKSVLQKIMKVANAGVKYHETGDYGTQPSHYVSLAIGMWNRPFKMIMKNEQGKTVAGIKLKSFKALKAA